MHEALEGEVLYHAWHACAHCFRTFFCAKVRFRHMYTPFPKKKVLHCTQNMLLTNLHVRLNRGGGLRAGRAEWAPMLPVVRCTVLCRAGHWLEVRLSLACLEVHRNALCVDHLACELEPARASKWRIVTVCTTGTWVVAGCGPQLASVRSS